MSPTARALYHALIRTHHITSRKKVAKLRQAADKYACHVLLRSGGSPGIMYVEGEEEGVKEWVAAVQRLRYKDYQLASRMAPLSRETQQIVASSGDRGLFETDSVKDFGLKMQDRGVLTWWRRGMGYAD
ncbi:hypothetical protein BJ546DRAFT_39593 [Cryomyces antarcticus]